jgi:hypothetical protein
MPNELQEPSDTPVDFVRIFLEMGGERWDVNPRPLEPQSRALLPELLSRAPCKNNDRLLGCAHCGGFLSHKRYRCRIHLFERSELSAAVRDTTHDIVIGLFVNRYAFGLLV